MRSLKKIGVYLVLVALLAGFTGMLCSPLIEECIGVLSHGVGGADYLMVGAGGSGELAVLGVKQGTLFLVRGNTAGERTDQIELDMSDLPANWRTAVCYPDGPDSCFLGFYDLDKPTLKLYHVQEGKTTLMLERKAVGGSIAEQMASVQIASFSRTNGIVSIVLLESGVATVFTTLEDGSGLLQTETFPCGKAQAACVLADGRPVLADGGKLVFHETGDTYDRENQIISDLRQVGAGIYSLDRAGLKVFYTDLASPDRFQPVIELEKGNYDLNGVVDWSMTADGELLLLLQDGRLLLERSSGTRDLSGMLYRPRLSCVLILAGLAFAVLFAAFVIWLVVCQWMGMRISLLLRWGALLTAVAVLGVFGLLNLVLKPAEQSSAAARAYELAGSVTALTLEMEAVSDGRFASLLGDSMASAGMGEARDTVVAVYEKDKDSLWRLQHGNTGAYPGTRAELTMDFDRELALLAQEQGAVTGNLTRDGQNRYCYYRMAENRLILVSIGGEGYQAVASSVHSMTRAGLWIAAGFLLLLSLTALVWVVSRLSRVIQGLERINRGESGVRVRMDSGDELESLSRCVNTLAGTMEGLEQRQQELSQSYRRFVPERVLSLLGKQQLQDVDKQTVASKKMVTMMVWFQFPQPVYEKSGQALFDNLNEIIERTAPIIARNGGTVFNFAYDGYDAVFEGGAELAISTAVAVRQEILAINNERELDGKATVDLRIALDEGTILMGLVGDESQMEPIAVSSCFSVTKRLIGLCKKLDASILCTETVAAAAAGYGSRYVGKCVDGGTVIRTHEIYDGDCFDVRRVKAQTAKQFSEGVYLLYSLDFAGAKRVFLNLVHHHTGDGGAKYYLFLADELEKHQDQDINLDYQL